MCRYYRLTTSFIRRAASAFPVGKLGNYPAKSENPGLPAETGHGIADMELLHNYDMGLRRILQQNFSKQKR